MTHKLFADGYSGNNTLMWSSWSSTLLVPDSGRANWERVTITLHTSTTLVDAGSLNAPITNSLSISGYIFNGCPINTYLYNFQCLAKCPYNYWAKEETQTCEICRNKCGMCSLDWCLECKEKILWDNWCYDECPTGMYKGNGTCLPCSEGCLECTGPGLDYCQKCDQTKGLVHVDERYC